MSAERQGRPGSSPPARGDSARVPIVSVISIVALILTGIVGLLPVVGDWLPSALIGATFHLAAGGGWTYSAPLIVTAVVSVVLVGFGVRRLEQREI